VDAAVRRLTDCRAGVRLTVRRLAILRAAVLGLAVRLVAVFRAGVLRLAVLLPTALRAGVLRAGVLRADVLRAGVLRADVLRAGVLRADVLRRRDWPDSDMAIAIACLRLFTFLPEPLFNVPRLCSRMTFSTFFF
jgi:hypothetical protein